MSWNDLRRALLRLAVDRQVPPGARLLGGFLALAGEAMYYPRDVERERFVALLAARRRSLLH